MLCLDHFLYHCQHHCECLCIILCQDIFEPDAIQVQDKKSHVAWLHRALLWLG